MMRFNLLLLVCMVTAEGGMWTDVSLGGRHLTFFQCLCDKTITIEGDVRPYEHRCFAQGYNLGDSEREIEMVMGPTLDGLYYVRENGQLSAEAPEYRESAAPSTGFDIEFRFNVEASKVAVGVHPISYVLTDRGSDSRVTCILEHEQIEEGSERVTGTMFTLSDFMGSLNGIDNTEDPLVYPIDFLNYLWTFPREAHWTPPMIVSAGNYIGGSPWNIGATDNVAAFSIQHLSKLLVGNVGDLELALGKEHLTMATEEGDFQYISSNIYYRQGESKNSGTTLVWPDRFVTTLESAPSSNEFSQIPMIFFGLMTKATEKTLHPDLLNIYEIRTDFETTYTQINTECQSLKLNQPELQCILLVSGGLSPLYHQQPHLEIQENQTEFAKIVNTFTHFDGFVGSRTMVEAKLTLPNNRWVIQSLPRGINVGRIDFERPSRIPLYPNTLLSLQPFGIPNDQDPQSVPDRWTASWTFLFQPFLDQADSASPNVEIGIFEGFIPVASDPLLPSSSYTDESPIATLIADAIAERSGADIVILEGNIAAFGLHGDQDEENILTSRHVDQLLFRPKTTIVPLLVTAAQLWEVLYAQWDSTATTSTDHQQFRPLALSGLHVSYDLRRPSGSQITNVQVRGTPIARTDTQTTYSLVVSDYLRAGALGHTLLSSLPIDGDAGHASNGGGTDLAGDAESEYWTAAAESEYWTAAAESEYWTAAAEKASLTESGHNDDSLRDGVSVLDPVDRRRLAPSPVDRRRLAPSPVDRRRLAKGIIADLFKEHVAEHPVAAPTSRMVNSTVVVARDALVQVSYPDSPPSSPKVPFTVRLHFTSKTSAVLRGPFNLYRRDTGENLGQIAEIAPDNAEVLTFQCFLGPLSQLLTFYMTNAEWHDQSYNRDLAFAVSVPGLADDASSEDNDTSSHNPTPTPTATKRPASGVSLNLSKTVYLTLAAIIAVAAVF